MEGTEKLAIDSPGNEATHKTTRKTATDKILEAAMVIFARNGYNGATTKKIAEEAGVNEITIFRKFKSKENLLKMVIEKNLRETLKKLDEIICTERSAEVEIGVKTLGITLKQLLDDKADFLFILLREGRKRPEIIKTFNQFRIKLIEHLSEYFQDQMNEGKIRKVDPDLLAIILFSFIFNKSLVGRAYDEYFSKDDFELFEEYTDIFMRGIEI